MKNHVDVIKNIEKSLLNTQKKIHIFDFINNKNLYKKYNGQKILITKQDKLNKSYKYTARFKDLKICKTRSYINIKKKGFSSSDMVSEKIHLFSPKLITVQLIRSDLL